MELASNGWSTSAVIKVIGAARPSIIGRDLMPNLGLQLVQRKPGQEVMSIQEIVGDEGESQLEKWQDYFSKLFSNLFNGVGKIRNYKVQAEFYKVQVESESDSQPLATRRIGRKLSLPKIQADLNEGHTGTMREGRSVTELAMQEKSAREQNEKATTSATEKRSGELAEIGEEDGIPEATERTSGGL